MCTHAYVDAFARLREANHGKTRHVKVRMDQGCGTPIARIRSFIPEDVSVMSVWIANYSKDDGNIVSLDEPWSNPETLDDITLDRAYTCRTDCDVWLVYMFLDPLDPRDLSVEVTDVPANALKLIINLRMFI